MALANIILDKLTTKRGPEVDTVNQKYCLFRYDDAEVLDLITIIDIDVMEDSKIMESPVESGIIVSDHRIKNPIEIVVNCALDPADWRTTYDELKGWYEQNTTDFLTIQTKADVYENMQLIAIPHKESSESISRLFFELRFRSILFVEPEYVKMKTTPNPEDRSRIAAGKKQGVEVSPGVQIILDSGVC